MIVMKMVVIIILLIIALAAVFNWWNAQLSTNILYVLTLVFTLTFFNIKEITIKLFSVLEFSIKLFTPNTGHPELVSGSHIIDIVYYVYILTNKYNTTFYIGVTNNLSRRIFEHQEKFVAGFSQKYNLTKLVHVEEFNNAKEAILREKQLKNWHRDWKINLIKQNNPLLKDLSEEV